MSIELENINVASGDNGGNTPASSLPIIVTSSGSSLPVDLSGYQVGDTFLNTSDKKIYTSGVNGYVANTNTTLTVNVDYITGIASGFEGYKECSRTDLTNLWYGNNETHHSIKFKVSTIQATPVIQFASGGSGSYYYSLFYISNDGFIYHKRYRYSYGTVTVDFNNKILDTEIDADKIYILNITKTGTNCVAQLTDESGTVLEEKNFTTTDLPLSTNSIYYGTGRIETPILYSSNLSVYLGQSTGELVIPNTSTMIWDNGTDITDKTEYADKTNGILYLYEDTELIQIPLIDLSNYKLKATTTTIDTASVTVSEIKANTNYVFSNNAITDITLSGCETSFEETTIEFTTGSTAPTLTDNSGITWVDGSAPTLNASKSYIIVIFNKIGFVKEY